jgi:hypothetical protein
MLNATELNNKMSSLIQISSQENMLLKSIEKFYSTLKFVNDFISIINSNSKISIRLIDYFVTKYSKKNKINYKIDEDNLFSIYQSYKQQLKAFQKKNFDPFARGIRIPYFVENVWIITTIGQLNFFKWFISKNILEYVNKNKEIIEFDMNKNKVNKIDSKNKKLYKLSKKTNFKIMTNIQQQTNQSNNKLKSNIKVTF